jgi:HK97 family phage portal protein
MGLLDENHTATLDYLRDLEQGIEREAPLGVSQGSIGYGAGGPVYLDAFRSKRPPTPSELVNSYKAVAFACISLNANAVAKVPFRLYCRTSRSQAEPRFWETRRLDARQKNQLRTRLGAWGITRTMAQNDDQIDELVDHPFLSLLDKPNPYFNGWSLIQHLVRSLDAVGTCYWCPERLGPEWCPTEIWPLHSQYCYPLKGYGRTIIEKYVYFADEFQFDELIRFYYVSLRDHYLSGYAPLHACFEQLGLIDYYTAVIESTLKTGARPEAMVGPKDPKQPWPKGERERVEKMVNNRFSNGNQGRIWAVDGSFDFHTLSYAPADISGLSISKDARLLAANCFDVPISMLEAENSNKATAQEGATQHQRNAVEPRCANIAAMLTEVVQRIDRRLFIAHDDVVQRDRKTDAAIHKVYLDTRVITRNEVRADLGLEPKEGLDEIEKPQQPQQLPGKPATPDEEKEEDDEK